MCQNFLHWIRSCETELNFENWTRAVCRAVLVVRKGAIFGSGFSLIDLAVGTLLRAFQWREGNSIVPERFFWSHFFDSQLPPVLSFCIHTFKGSTMMIKMIPMMCWFTLLLAASTAWASKDSDYYFPGFSNPLTRHKMYWKDSINVLQDLDQFKALYIKYHHCV